MSNNYNNYYSLNNFYNRNKNYPKKKFQFQNKGNIREVEINSISQTEPTKQKETYNNNNQIYNVLNQIDQFDNISKTNDETLSITNFKQEFIGCNSDDIIFRDFISSQVKTLLSKLEDIDLDKKFNEISNKLLDVKNSLENKIEDYNKKNEEEILEIKELFEWQSMNDLRKKLILLKGEKYYDSILSNDLKEKFFKNNKSFSEIISMIYEDYKENNKYKDNNSDNLNDNNENKLILNLSGTIYRIIKHFRGLSDDIIIDFGELIPFLDTKEKIDNAKRNINIVVNLIYEILGKQIEISELSNKIFAYGHFFYGYKGNNIELKEFDENSIYFDFIELN